MTKHSKELKQEVEKLIVDEFGNYLEQIGGKTLMGRIWGLLITKSEPISLTHIAKELHVSKPAVSTIINIAIQLGAFKKVYVQDFPRENFYQLDIDSMAMMIDPGIQKMKLLLDKFEKSITMMENSKKILEKDEELKKIYKRLSFIKKSTEIVLEEYFIFGNKVKSRILSLKK